LFIIFFISDLERTWNWIPKIQIPVRHVDKKLKIGKIISCYVKKLFVY